MATRKVRIMSVDLLPMELVGLQEGGKEEKLREEKYLRDKIKRIREVIEEWGDLFDQCEEGPLWKEFGKQLCAYFETAIKPAFLDKENKEILEEYEKYKKKRGRNKLKRRIKSLEYEKKLLQEAFEECCKGI